MLFPENRKIKITVGLHQFCSRKFRAIMVNVLKIRLFQSSKHGHLNNSEEQGINTACEEWQKWGSSAGEGKVRAKERNHSSARDDVLIS